MSNARELANLVSGTLTNLTSGTNNVALGDDALEATTSGERNVGIGKDAATANTTGSRNVAVGHQSLLANTVGSRSVAIGHNSLSAQNPTSATDMYNTAVGHEAGAAITTGVSNTALGALTADALTTGDGNVIMGYAAGGAATTTDHSVLIGYEAGGTGTLTGHDNVFVGMRSGKVNTSGGQNVGIGREALAANTTASNNTAVGHNSGQNVTTGYQNTLVGSEAGHGLTTGYGNTYIGRDAGYFGTTGSNNTFVGTNAAQNVTTGSNHTVIGKYSGNGYGLDIRTATDPYIIFSGGDAKPAMFFNEASGTLGTWFAGNHTNNTYWPMASNSSGQNSTSINISDGSLGLTGNGGNVLYVNRNNADGDLARWYSQGGHEGTVSVSGTTVTYGGGHLGRWSQLTDGSKDTSILKGTVMTNLDQMCVWSHDAVAEGDSIKNAMGETIIATADDVADAYTENNEQLNCTAVSSAEGDANVAGVFVKWDSADDDYNDMMIAMTGDMVIRIAQGTTVARGDLLMSAGDGTAKPQDDDIVRSKTIAKVTSTNVSHTYDDGSYLVPCVLMAC